MHPFRDYKARVYRDIEAGKSPQFIGFLGPHGVVPMHFSGETEVEVRAKIEAFRLEAIENYEAALIKRREAAEKRKAK